MKERKTFENGVVQRGPHPAVVRCQPSTAEQASEESLFSVVRIESVT
jgi:hypothetical protein